ncbi:uncharacterized protein METZ01_LOCUS68878 [marine metagenome]|uniref:Uncharacterized protein n=1 Tax=marine metagenome TaxID=408172 RepID=A0A381TJR8_9ZZZZ
MESNPNHCIYIVIYQNKSRTVLPHQSGLFLEKEYAPMDSTKGMYISKIM